MSIVPQLGLKVEVTREQQGDHAPDNVTFPDISLMVCGTSPRHSAC